MRAIIIGATSGIGQEMARQMLAEGWHVGITGRRIDRLESLARAHPGKVEVQRMDVTDPEAAEAGLADLITRMGGVDTIVLSSGVGKFNKALDTLPEVETIDVNVIGFTHLALAAMRYFLGQGAGHLVIISSIASRRGDRAAPAYNASKAYQARYAEGLRKYAVRKGSNITVTDVQPGYVDTAIVQGKVPWLQPVDKAVRQILSGMTARSSRIVVTRRWRYVAWAIERMPERLWHRL